MSSTIFKEELFKTILAYVDDILVKSIKRQDHISDLAAAFARMREAGLKLNPEKCVFGVTKGKILGCLVSANKIEANPDKINAILDMEEPKCIRDVQKLSGRIAALNRFIAKAAERSLPFFATLRNAAKFEWGEEQSKAFQELRQYLMQLTKLTILDPKAPLLLYIAASQSAVSAALIAEKDIEGKKVQQPVYYVSEALAVLGNWPVKETPSPV